MTTIEFMKLFPDDDACLDYLFKLYNPDLTNCLKCGEDGIYRRVRTRQCYQCAKCKHQLYPCKGSPFQKSTTSLWKWFYIIHHFVETKNGLSAKHVERLIGVSYKTAHRMLMQIRKFMKQNTDFFSGDVMIDETFIGGKNQNRHYKKRVKKRDYGIRSEQNRYFPDKHTVIGLLNKGGDFKAFPIDRASQDHIHPILFQNIEMGATIITDEHVAYKRLEDVFCRYSVDHSKHQYVDHNGLSTNPVENVWSIMKRTFKGSYVKQLSKRYLQLYVNEVVFRFNNRKNPNKFFTFFERMKVCQV